MLPPCLKVCFKSSGSSSGSNSSPTFSSKTWWMNDEWWCSLRKQPIFWDALVSPSEDRARKFHTGDVLLHRPWLCFRLVENLLQPIRINTQILVVTRYQYGISALVPQASPLGNHWWPRKTWWFRLFSQAMIDVFFSLNELPVVWIGLTSNNQDWKVKKKSFIFLSKGGEKQMSISRNLKNKGKSIRRLKTEPVLLIHLNTF